MTDRVSNVVLNFKQNGQVQYAQTLKQINMVMQTASKEYQAQVAAMGRNASATEKLRAEKKKLESQLTASADKVQMLRDEFEAMQNDSSASAESLQRLYNQLLSAETAHSKLEQAVDRVNEGLSDSAIAARDAKEQLKSLTDDSKALDAEQRRLTSAFELQHQALGENATETERAELALQQYQQQTALAQQGVTNLEQRLQAAKTAYGENSVEVARLETQLNQARLQMQRTADEFNRVATDAENASNELAELSDEAKRLEAEQRRLASSFELQAQALGANASEAERAELAMRQHTQQTELAGKAIANLERQLDAARRAYGENSAEVMELETRLNQTRLELGRLGEAANEAEREVEGMGAALSGIGTVVGAAGVAALVDEFTEVNQALGMLEVQAQNAGIAIDGIGEGKVALSAVNHDANQIAETMGNLMQAGYDNVDAINQISEALAGAKVKYGETFSGEGLAESITTTTQLGEVTGQLTDLLEKEGVNVENFNAKMQEMGSVQERANYISQLLANQGLNSMYQEYAALNPELVKNAEATTKNESAMAELATALTPLATMFTNTATSVVEWVNENEGLALGLAGVGLALGGVTTAFATLAPAISAVVPLFTTGGLAAGGLGAALAAVAGPVGLTVAALTGVGVAVAAASHHLSQSSIEVEDWKDKVSESTAEAVGSFMDLSEQATLALNQLAWSGQTVTEEMAAGLINTYDQMGQQILAEMQADHAAQLQSMTDHFAMSQALTETEEAEILAAMQAKNAEKELAHQESQARIAEILNLAKEEKRAITEAEQIEINSIQQTMTDNAIQYLSENEREQKVIYENLKNEASKITAEQAAEVVKNSLDQKEKVVAEAQDQYAKTVAEIIKQRDETGTISAEQAQKLIDEAKKQRDGVVTNAEDMHSNVVKEAKSQATEHAKEVDWETGQVKSKWEVLKTNVGTTMSNLGADIGNKWDSALSTTKSKAENIKNEASRKFDEMKTKISNSIETAKDAVGTAIDKIKGFFNFSWSLPKLKLPKISIKGDFSLNPPRVPTFGIDWFAKGGIMTRPTAFGINGNNLMVGGEAGPEAILPLNSQTLGKIGDAIASQMPMQQMPTTIVVQSILDGRVVAESITPFVSQNQRQHATLSGNMRGVNL